METLAGEGDGGPQGSGVREAATQVSKVARVDDQVDVHTRLPESNQETQKLKFPTEILEVFSVRFLEMDKHDMNQMYGCISIIGSPHYVLFSRKDGDPLCINSEGFLKLTGPERVIEPCDYIGIIPHLFRYQACADQFEGNSGAVMFNTIMNNYYDMFLSRRAQSQFGPIEVNYAVYLHGIEARVDVTLMGCQFPSAVVYGWICAYNSKIGDQGKSFLFNREKSEGIPINASSCKDRVAQLPLARWKTSHTIDSLLTICVNIWESSIDSQDQPIAENQRFEFIPKLGTRQLRTFKGTKCLLNVSVMWPEKPEYGSGQLLYV